MNNIQKRFLLFLIGCIGARTGFVYIAKNSSLDNLPILGYLALLPALAFTLLYVFNLRQTGQEVFGDKIWWNHLRPIHGLLYFSFAYMAINKNPNAWMLLLIDVTLGLVSFLHFHYTSGNMKYL
jgi:hypothetical protein